LGHPVYRESVKERLKRVEIFGRLQKTRSYGADVMSLQTFTGQHEKRGTWFRRCSCINCCHLRWEKRFQNCRCTTQPCKGGYFIDVLTFPDIRWPVEKKQNWA